MAIATRSVSSSGCHPELEDRVSINQAREGNSLVTPTWELTASKDPQKK